MVFTSVTSSNTSSPKQILRCPHTSIKPRRTDYQMEDESHTMRVISQNSLGGQQTIVDERNLDYDRLSEAAMVEADEDDCSDEIMNQDFPVAHVPDSESRSSEGGSSLSSEEDVMNLEDMTRPPDNPPTSILRPYSSRMNRSDSRGSNDSSSGSVKNSLNGGYWGWFEDVHGGELHSSDTATRRDSNYMRKKIALLQRFGNHSSNNRSNLIPPSAKGEFSQRFLLKITLLKFAVRLPWSSLSSSPL